MNRSRIVLLLGAGASIAAGLPGTQKITEEALSEEGLKKTKRKIIWDDGRKEEKYYDPEIRNFLTILRCIAEKYNPHEYLSNGWRKRHFVNYEDLLYMLMQIQDTLIAEFNPFGEILKKETRLKELISGWTPPYKKIEGRDDEYIFIELAFRYIKNTVVRMLKSIPEDTSNLNVIKEIVHDADFSGVDIISLNHDLLMEEYLKEISPVDGFRNIGEEKIWTPEIFHEENSGNSRLLKLHGSINWYWKRNEDIGKEYLCIFDGKETHVTNDEVGNRLFGPYFLSGTENKIFAYMTEVYGVLQRQARDLLKKTKTVIVIGYSFGDKGINFRLLEWLGKDRENMIVVIDGNKNLGEVVPQNIRRHWHDYTESKRIIHDKKKLEEVDFAEMKAEYFSG